MKSMRAVLVLAGLGLLGALVMAPAAIAQTPPAKDRLVVDRKARRTGDHPRRQGLSEDLQGGPDPRRAGESGKAARGRQAPARAFAAFRREAPARNRKIRRQLAQGFHRTGRLRERRPHRFARQDPDLRLHGHQDHPQSRPRLEGQRRRQDDDDLPAQGRQVVRRHAVHRERFHVLVQRHLSQQEHQPHAVLRVPDQRQGRGDEEGRRLHGRLRVSRALSLLRFPARGQHGHRRRVRDARRLPELRRRLCARPIT